MSRSRPCLTIGFLLALFSLFTGGPARSEETPAPYADLKNELIFHPETALYNTPAAFRVKYEELRLPSASGPALNAWLVPGESDLTFLMFSGNGGNISLLLDRMLGFHRLGFSSLSVDYPGYGASEGRPSEEGTYEAAEAGWKYLTEVKKIPPERIVIYGFSLGGGVASWLAARHQARALILDSTFTKVLDVAAHHAPELQRQLIAVMNGAYDTEARLAEIHGPLLILHSPDDRTVPYEFGLRLYERYVGGPKTMVVGSGGHMDFALNPEYLRAVKTFIASTDEQPQTAQGGSKY